MTENLSEHHLSWTRKDDSCLNSRHNSDQFFDLGTVMNISDVWMLCLALCSSGNIWSTLPVMMRVLRLKTALLTCLENITPMTSLLLQPFSGSSIWLILSATSQMSCKISTTISIHPGSWQLEKRHCNKLFPNLTGICEGAKSRMMWYLFQLILNRVQVLCLVSAHLVSKQSLCSVCQLLLSA